MFTPGVSYVWNFILVLVALNATMWTAAFAVVVREGAAMMDVGYLIVVAAFVVAPVFFVEKLKVSVD